MNTKLRDMYIHGLQNGYLIPDSAEYISQKGGASFLDEIIKEEDKMYYTVNDKKAFNSPEFQSALKVYNSKLVGVLK